MVRELQPLELCCEQLIVALQILQLPRLQRQLLVESAVLLHRRREVDGGVQAG